MRNLRRGMRGYDILDIQGYLDDLGYKIQPTSIYDRNIYVFRASNLIQDLDLMGWWVL